MTAKILITTGLAFDVLGVVILYFTTSVKHGLNEVLSLAERNSRKEIAHSDAAVRRRSAVASNALVRIGGLLLIPTGFVLQGIGVWL